MSCLTLLVTSSISAIMALFLEDNSWLPTGPGGIIGYQIAWGLIKHLNVFGTSVTLTVLTFACLTFLLPVSWASVLQLFARMVKYAFRSWQEIIEQNNLKPFHPTKSQPHFDLAPVAKSSKQKNISFEAIKPNSKIKTKAKTAKPSISSPITTQHLTLDLLESPKAKAVKQMSSDQLQVLSETIELRLSDFGIQSKVVSVRPGPVVTRFELDLAAGTKVSKVTSLAKDLARSLSLVSVRVVEVIAGKSLIGIEIPNEHRQTVYLQQILGSKEFSQTKHVLPLGLGKDISGKSIVVDLSKMPHLLVAGTTGSGKSVGLNAMLLSLLYQKTPDMLRMIMIDPKMLELSIYDNIPHLLTPVVTDMNDAASALRWCVAEMDRRYQLMAACGVRNLSGYNNIVKQKKIKLEDLGLTTGSLIKNDEEYLTHMPHIVVLADEFADMIMVVGKKVEQLIARLAQKARAAGIHLILATQRPSVDVITGLIKANIPTRIAFNVSSKIDSRTILDQQGAEQLLGHGDMLYLPPGTALPIRVHGAFVDDQEVHRVVQAVKSMEKVNYVENLCSISTSNGTESESDQDGEKDELYDQAVAIVIETRKSSISYIQRRLKIGYNRAANLIETMEKYGILGPMSSNGSREILIEGP